MISDIFRYYRTDEPKAEQYDAWFPFCQNVSGNKTTIDQIKNRIYLDRESVPRNIPKAINEAYSKIPHDSFPTGYNRDSDPRFPVTYLQSGLELLLRTRDVIAFQNWADQVGMPKDDQERVKHKANIALGRIRFNRAAHRRNVDAKRHAVSVGGPEAARAVGNEDVWTRDKGVAPGGIDAAEMVGDVGELVVGNYRHGNEAFRSRNMQNERAREVCMREPGEEG